MVLLLSSWGEVGHHGRLVGVIDKLRHRGNLMLGRGGVELRGEVIWDRFDGSLLGRRVVHVHMMSVRHDRRLEFLRVEPSSAAAMGNELVLHRRGAPLLLLRGWIQLRCGLVGLRPLGTA